MADLQFIVDRYGHKAIAVWTAMKRYHVCSRGTHLRSEWFVGDTNLAGGEFAAGPFPDLLDAEMALAQFFVEAAIDGAI